ncbi:YcjF family protein [Paraglaciecola aestuariivivens]
MNNEHQNTSQQNNKIKQAYVFDSEVEAEPLQPEKLKPAQKITDEQALSLTPIEPTLETQAQNNQPIDSHKPAAKSSRWRLAVVGLVLVASLLEVGLFMYSAINQQDWLAGLWLVILFIAILALVRWGFYELKSLTELKKLQSLRTRSSELANKQVIGRAEQHCLELIKSLPKQAKPWVQDWSTSLESHHTDSEVLALFEHKVMAELDKQALQKIKSHASAASVLIALSPFALVDMLIVLWRNILMLNQISRIYGLRLGYWARIRLIKNILHNMLYAGAAEILSDAGNYALGASVTSKLSTRVAQGLGAGVLTARLGLKAIDQSRPFPWLSEPKPGLSELSKQLLSDLRNHLS